MAVPRGIATGSRLRSERFSATALGVLIALPSMYSHDHHADMMDCRHVGMMAGPHRPSRCRPRFRHQSSSISCPISWMVVPFSPAQPRICRLASGVT